MNEEKQKQYNKLAKLLAAYHKENKQSTQKTILKTLLGLKQEEEMSYANCKTIVDANTCLMVNYFLFDAVSDTNAIQVFKLGISVGNQGIKLAPNEEEKQTLVIQVATLHKDFAVFLREKANYSDSIQHCKTGIALLEEYPQPIANWQRLNALARLYGNLGNAMTESQETLVDDAPSQYQKATKFIADALQLPQDESQNDQTRVMMYKWQSDLKGFQLNWLDKLGYKLMKDFYELSQSRRVKAESNPLEEDSKAETSELEQSLQLRLSSLETMVEYELKQTGEDVHQTYMLGNIYCHLSVLYHFKDDYAKALHYFELAEEQFKQTLELSEAKGEGGDPRTPQFYLFGMVFLNTYSGLWSNAYSYLNSIKISDKTLKEHLEGPFADGHIIELLLEDCLPKLIQYDQENRVFYDQLVSKLSNIPNKPLK